MSSVFDGSELQNSVSWFKAKEVSDSVEGTYVDFRVQVGSKFYPTSVQMIYTLLQDNGSLINVSHGITHLRIHEKMQDIALGQKVGFIITGSKDKVEADGEKKIFFWEVKTNNEVNHEWVRNNQDVINAHTESPVALALLYVSKVTLEKMKEKSNYVPVVKPIKKLNVLYANSVSTNEPASQPAPTTPQPAPIVSTEPGMTTASIGSQSQDFSAKLNEVTEMAKKMGATDAESVKVIVKEKTGLDFTVDNIDAIVEKMKALSSPF